MVTLTVDGKEITVPDGTLVIRAAEQLGIEIPRFCEHPFLSPIGAWNVRRSFDRTRTVLRMDRIRFVGSAVGGRGRGIFPRGPSTIPRRSWRY